jgi:hypothetical protein
MEKLFKNSFHANIDRRADNNLKRQSYHPFPSLNFCEKGLAAKIAEDCAESLGISPFF